MLTPGTTVSDVSQATRTSGGSRSGTDRSAEFGEALSAVSQENRSSRDGDRNSEADGAAEDGDLAESSGTRPGSRLALSFLQKGGNAESVQAQFQDGQLSGADLSLLGEAAGLDGIEGQLAAGRNSALKGTLATRLQQGQKGLQDQAAEVAGQNNGDAVKSLSVDSKTKKATSGEGKSSETDLKGVEGQTAASLTEGVQSAVVAGDVETSAQAVATLLGGLMGADGTQPQLKTSSRSDGGSTRTDKDGKLVSGSRGMEASDLDASVAADALNKSILEQSATADEAEKRAFRLTSAQNGRSLDMTIGTDQSGKATFDTSTKTSGAETVTVLDSRRYLGFTQSANGAALTSTIAGDSEWQKAMQPGAALQNEQARAGTSNVVNTLKLQMTPIDLGTVTATLRLVGEELTVHLTVETRAAHQQLSEDSSGILGALRAQGFSVDQVSVAMSSQDTNAQTSGDGQQRSSDANAQQGNSQSQGQSSGRSEASAKHASNELEAAPDPRSSISDSAGRASDIYL